MRGDNPGETRGGTLRIPDAFYRISREEDRREQGLYSVLI